MTKEKRRNFSLASALLCMLALSAPLLFIAALPQLITPPLQQWKNAPLLEAPLSREGGRVASEKGGRGGRGGRVEG
jgi:hypothetical protein